MEDTKDETLSDSFTPIAVETRTTREELAINKGKVSMFIVLIAFLSLMAGGSGIWLRSTEHTNNYRVASVTLNSIKRTEFDGFWDCALPGNALSAITSRSDLVAKIQERRRANAFFYAKLIREHCLGNLRSSYNILNRKNFPSDLREFAERMKDAIGKTRKAWEDYIIFLTNSVSSFDEDKATAFETQIASAWDDFMKAHSELNDLLNEKLKYSLSIKE
jgi:hypothetical protein